MKVYVLFKDYGWDGAGYPLKVTKSKMEAKLWAKEDPKYNSFVELKLEKED